jgi:hypothetical protein
MTRQVAATIPVSPVGTPGAGSALPSAYWGSANGARIVSGALSWPLYGAWTADLVLQTTTPLSGPVTLTVGNLTLAGAVYRQATFAGVTEVRLVAGAGGWSKAVQARGYDNAGGVLRSQVLADAAAEVGESVVVATDGSVGNGYARIADKAARVLRANAGSQWWIDSGGVTHVGPRPSTAITSAFTVEAFSGASGTLRIATGDPASWVPGNTFASATVAQQTIASIRHHFGPDGRARLEVMTSATNDRWIEDIRELIRQEVSASVPYAQSYEYVVTASSGTSIGALPVDPTRGVPPLTSVPYRSGVPGGSATLTPGTHVCIGFLDGNPGKPALLGVFDGTAPLTETIGVSGTLTLGDASAAPLVHASWMTNLVIVLETFAAALSTSVTLANVIASGGTLGTGLSAMTPSPTTKVLGT